LIKLTAFGTFSKHVSLARWDPITGFVNTAVTEALCSLYVGTFVAALSGTEHYYWYFRRMLFLSVTFDVLYQFSTCPDFYCYIPFKHSGYY
jgi:hypothetical protein